MTIDIEDLRKHETPTIATQKVWLFSEAVHSVLPLLEQIEKTTVLSRANELALAIKSRLELAIRATGEEL